MIKVRLAELNGLINSFNEFLQEELPVKAVYWANKNLKKLIAEAQEFESNRLKLVDKYATKDENGKPKVEEGQFVFDDYSAFNADYLELANIEAEFDTIPLSPEQLGDITIKGKLIFNLGPFAEE